MLLPGSESEPLLRSTIELQRCGNKIRELMRPKRARLFSSEDAQTGSSDFLDDGGAFGSRDSAPVRPRLCSERGFALGLCDLEELDDLLSEPPGQRRGARCAKLCTQLQFFTRLTSEQAAALFNLGSFLTHRAGEFVYRRGDPLGQVYVVLSGSVAMEQPCEEIGGRSVFVKTLFDGKAFGDTYNAGENGKVLGSRRLGSAIAQEDCRLLRMTTEEYLTTCTCDRQSSCSLLELVGFFSACSQHQIAVLAALMEHRIHEQRQVLVNVGDNPNVFRILSKGQCSLRARTADDRWLPFRKLTVGVCFGHGALVGEDGICGYSASNSIKVEAMQVELYAMSRASLLDTLPDWVFESVIAKVEAVQKDDPIAENPSKALALDAAWRLEKSRILAEERRCLGTRGSRCLGPGGGSTAQVPVMRRSASAPWLPGPARPPSRPRSAGLVRRPRSSQLAAGAAEAQRTASAAAVRKDINKIMDELSLRVLADKDKNKLWRRETGFYILDPALAMLAP